MNKIAIFASGTGSNAEKIIQYFNSHSSVAVDLVVSNRKNAGVLKMAEANGVDTLIIERSSFYGSTNILNTFRERDISYLILAGFLWLIPEKLIERFPKKIINIHPALLPAYGGKGMYGMNVHKAVFNAKEKESGISIHFVNAHYDEGELIFQAKCPIHSSDTPATIAAKVLQLEHQHFAEVIERVIADQ